MTPNPRTRLSRFEIFPEVTLFRNKPSLLYTTQCPDLFITYEEGFKMNTGKRNPLQLTEGEQNDRLSTKQISGSHSKSTSFPNPKLLQQFCHD